MKIQLIVTHDRLGLDVEKDSCSHCAGCMAEPNREQYFDEVFASVILQQNSVIESYLRST